MAMLVARNTSSVAGGVPSTGGSSDAVTYPTSGLQQFGFAIILFFPLLALVVVALRVASRLSARQFGLDDAVIVVAMVLSFGETATTWMFMKTNFIGIHIQDVPPDYDVITANIWNYAVQVLYNPILALVKTSVLLFLLKLGSQKPGVRWCIHALNALNLGLMVAIFLVVIFQCAPIAYNWDTSIPNAHCINRAVFYVATAGLTIFTDVLNLALPFWIFLDLKMPLRVKITLMFVFLLGAIVTVVGIVRLVFIYQGFFLPPKPGADPTYSLGFCTSAIETNLAIICASAPSLRGLVRHWFPHFFSDANYGYNYGSSDNTGGRSRNNRQRRHAPGTNPYGAGSIATNITSRRKGAGGGGGEIVTDADGLAVTGDNNNNNNRRGIKLRDLKGGGMSSKTHAVVGSSPSASEEEIMTYNGIVRTTNVTVHYDNDRDRKASMRDRSRDRSGSSVGMRTSISGSL